MRSQVGRPCDSPNSQLNMCSAAERSGGPWRPRGCGGGRCRGGSVGNYIFDFPGVQTRRHRGRGRAPPPWPVSPAMPLGAPANLPSAPTCTAPPSRARPGACSTAPARGARSGYRRRGRRAATVTWFRWFRRGSQGGMGKRGSWGW
jgi:hypothetical protein